MTKPIPPLISGSGYLWQIACVICVWLFSWVKLRCFWVICCFSAVFSWVICCFSAVFMLFSVECNFAAPLTDPTNAPFQKDMEAWVSFYTQNDCSLIISINNRSVEKWWFMPTSAGSHLKPHVHMGLCCEFWSLCPTLPELLHPGPQYSVHNAIQMHTWFWNFLLKMQR